MMKIFLSAAFAILLMASSAQAFTLTNRDPEEQRLQITEGGDEAVTHEVIVAADQTREDLCLEGCTIVLDSGEQASFEGDEVVEIEDGHFVIAE